jgi:hypothetical protein
MVVLYIYVLPLVCGNLYILQIQTRYRAAKKLCTYVTLCLKNLCGCHTAGDILTYGGGDYGRIVQLEGHGPGYMEGGGQFSAQPAQDQLHCRNLKSAKELTNQSTKGR